VLPLRRLVPRVLAATVIVAIPLIVWASVFLPGTQPADGSGDPAFPRFMDGLSPGTFERPGLCDNCHQGYKLASEPIYEPFDTWSGSMMANAARDPLVWAALGIANQDDAAIGDVGVGDFCLRCHVPRAWYEGRSSCVTPWGEEFDGSCLEGPPDVVDNDYEGIICSYCHRMYDASAPPAGQFADAGAPHAGNAQVYISTDERELGGPFSDAIPTGHTARGDTFFKSSALCGQCHDVTNPALNRRDAITGADQGYRMPIERTYSEWRQSRMADTAAPESATCQACHMPQPDLDGDGAPDDAYACSQLPGLRGQATALDGPIRMHVFAGANTWMLSVLRGEYGAALGRVAQFDRVIEVSTELLTQRSVTAGVTAPPSATAGDAVPVTVRVTNLAGHKFPTGYPEGRRAWIALAGGEDLDLDGALSPLEITWESCAYDAATGALTQDAQAKVYQAKLGIFNYNGTGLCDVIDDASGRELFHFVRNDCTAQDNRIPPLGFVPDAETMPVGIVYPANPALPGTLANWDDAPYVVPIPETATRDFIVEARVRYQSASREYVEFLRDENASTCDPRDPGCDPTQSDARSNRGEKLHALWEAYGRSAPLDLAFARAIIAVTPLPPIACCLPGACVDLLPGECASREGTSLGASTACGTDACPLTPPPPGEASNIFAGAAPLLVTRDGATGILTFLYAPACDATDHGLISGALASVATYSHDSLICGQGVSGLVAFDPGPGSQYFLVIGRSTAAEGSFGRDSVGAERPQRVGLTPCDEPQDLSATCG
jgi:hypothetical protein